MEIIPFLSQILRLLPKTLQEKEEQQQRCSDGNKRIG